MNDLFPIQTEKGTAVLDSRIIARELGLNHEDWFRNIYHKYLQVLENEFGTSVLKTEETKSGRKTKFAYLTEDQAIFLATLSRNTERVVHFKVKLVKSFQAARRALEAVQQIQAHSKAQDAAASRLEALEKRLAKMESTSNMALMNIICALNYKELGDKEGYREHLKWARDRC